MAPVEKRCTKCGSKGPFGKRKAAKDGLESRCKLCMVAIALAWQAANPEKVKATAKRQKQKPTSKEHNRIYMRNRYRTNADVQRAAREYRTTNRPALRLKNRQWRHDNPERARFHGKTKGARRRGAKVRTLTQEQWQEILEVFGHRCAYCLRPESACGKLTQEHVIAIVRGGDHSAENVVPACRSCNSSKHDAPVYMMALRLVA